MKNWFYINTSLIKAFFILIFAGIFLDALPQDPEVTIPSYSATAHIMSVLLLMFSLLSIRYIKGNSPVLNTWGYIWRYLITLTFTFILLMLISKSILRIDVSAETSELSQLICLFLTPIVVWLFFCNERIEYVKKVAMYFRGM